MQKPTIPKNEAQRLKELNAFNILIDDSNSDFDFITSLAAQICGTAISQISIVAEDKQWFLSNHGIDAKETSRDDSFCAHAINFPNEAFIVEDARNDDRFFDNPYTVGDPHVIFYAGIPLVSDNGFPLGSLCVINNQPKKLSPEQVYALKKLAKQIMRILELKKKQSELDQQNNILSLTNKKLEIVQESNKIGTWELEIETGNTTWSELVYQIHEVPPDFDHHKNNAIDFYHPNSKPIILSAVENAIVNNNTFDVVCQLITARGKTIWVRSTGKKMDGKLIGSFQDITYQKDAEQKLREAINHLQSILDASTQVAVIATDKTGVITQFNSGAEKMLGYTAAELVGKQTPELIHLEDEVIFESQELSVKHGKVIIGFETFVYETSKGKPVTKEWTYKHKDGRTFPVQLSVTAIYDNENIVGYLGVATDISALKKVEEEIKSLLDITKEQNSRLRNFAHIVSHNLRSHSAGISGLINIIQEDFPEIAANEIVDLIGKGAENLRQTVEDLTEVVNVNLTDNELTEVALYDVIEKNKNSISLQIKNAGIVIHNQINPDLKLRGVPAYIDSIVLNFMTNAIKYKSPDREPYLKIYANETPENWVLNFEDNGQGIDLTRHAEKLFGMYKTFHYHNDSRGVGLFITKNQIESMGGKIEVKSEVNIGTTFIVYLPK